MWSQCVRTGELVRGAFRAALAVLALASHARAQIPEAFAPASSGAAARWPVPLDRAVAFDARGVSLRVALDRLAASARIQISYSSELLPLTRRVEMSYDTITVGDALSELLRGTDAVPVVMTEARVVLTRSRIPRSPLLRASGGAQMMDRVVVTGNAVATRARPLSVGVEIIDGDRLPHGDRTSLSDLLNSAVPGLWVWSQSPATLVSRFGSVRGASSFGGSYPKIYVDGVEVANPALITQFDANSVERIEVLRGPQGRRYTARTPSAE
jgi:iron complex outermembrane receptor protein